MEIPLEHLRLHLTVVSGSVLLLFSSLVSILGMMPTTSKIPLNSAMPLATISSVRVSTMELMVGWCIFTIIMLIGTLRTHLALFGLFFTLTFAFLMLAISNYTGSASAQMAGGVFGLITATLAWYNAAAGLWNKGNSFIQLPLGHFPWAEKKNA